MFLGLLQRTEQLMWTKMIKLRGVQWPSGLTLQLIEKINKSHKDPRFAPIFEKWWSSFPQSPLDEMSFFLPKAEWEAFALPPNLDKFKQVHLRSDAKLQQVTQVKNSRKTGPQLDLERRGLSRRLIPRTVFAHEWQSFSAVLQHRKIFYFSFICSKCPHSWLDRNLRIGWNGNITGCPNKISLEEE